MLFPEQQIDTMSQYHQGYADLLHKGMLSIDQEALTEVASLLEERIRQGSTIFACGNGGSTAISNHLLCDVSKCVQTDTELVPKVVSLSACTEMITAIANDISYESVFLYQLRTMASPGDMLFTISSSGDSENVVRALEWANSNKVTTVALTGFDGGRTARLAHYNLHVEGHNYGIVEDCHQSIMHMLSQFVRQKNMTPALVPERKF